MNNTQWLLTCILVVAGGTLLANFWGFIAAIVVLWFMRKEYR